MRSLLGPLINRAQISYAQHGDDRRRLSGGYGRSGPLAQMDAMGASATLFSVINRTSTATAKVDWHLHVPAPGQSCEYGQGTEDECGEVGVQQVEKHPALVTLHKPNNFYTRQELFESGQQHVDLTGEGWLVVSYFGRMPAELWVARPDRMVVVTRRVVSAPRAARRGRRAPRDTERRAAGRRREAPRPRACRP